MTKVFDMQDPTLEISTLANYVAKGGAVRIRNKQQNMWLLNEKSLPSELIEVLTKALHGNYSNNETEYLMSCPKFAAKMKNADRQIRMGKGHVFTDHL